MRRVRTTHAASEKRDCRNGSLSLGKKVYVFRCEESGLYAFAADRKGRMLPSQIYPQISWRFEQTLTLRFDGNSSRDKLLRSTLDGVAKHGFYLIHAAIFGELLGFITQGGCAAH
jgi:hypothetical protein